MKNYNIRKIKFDGKKDQGFTLIELLVVIIIIGILAGIAVIGVSGAQSAAAKRACQANGVQLTKAIRAYYAANGEYPQPTPSPTHTFTEAELNKLTTTGAKFLEAVPEEAEDAPGSVRYTLKVILKTGDNSLTVVSAPKPVPSASETFCADVTG